MRQSFRPRAGAVLIVCALAAAGPKAPPFLASSMDVPSAAGNGDEGRAITLMDTSIDAIRTLRLGRGLPIDPALDPNGTGLIGDEFTPLTTSLGEVADKRTTTNPVFAAVMVRIFKETSLRAGDVVAVGASGSFPALLLATLSAARVLDLEPVVIYSVGSSMYGANLPGFTFVDMLAGLRERGLLPYGIAAVSAGGDGDRGAGVLFDEEGSALLAETRRYGLPVIAAPSLEASIQERLRVYRTASLGRPIRCYVNIGGASASVGPTEASLALPNGLVRRVGRMPDGPVRGVLFEFASRLVPVVHLLHARGLARAYDLPFDPVPLPDAFRWTGIGETR